MRILVTNDDGITAPGLHGLVQPLSAFGHTVYVVAPDVQRSAVGHGITVYRPLHHTKACVPGAEWAYALDGTPADCVKFAILHLMKDGPLPDVCLSGINYGQNVANDIMYSGTASAAAEGSYMGLKSIALSCSCDGGAAPRFEALARFVCVNLDALLSPPFPPYSILNINYPTCTPRGVALTRMGIYHYDDRYRVEPGDEGLWLRGAPLRFSEAPLRKPRADDDFVRLGENYITVTPVAIERTDAAWLAQLSVDKLKL
ncbi:MAG: 5'/3'-nucleotidase SurE [Clostridiales bacterium]|jgi:5'-nucleotidase|nr:5'/3'-nucleotidase SurE [Clostridiales bacterium]